MHIATLAIQREFKKLSIYQLIKTESPLQISYSALDGTLVQWQAGGVFVCLPVPTPQFTKVLIQYSRVT
jgi:hypothetical protein